MISAQTGSQILKTVPTGSDNRKLQFEFIFLRFLIFAITWCSDITQSRVTFAKSKPLVLQNQLELWWVNFLESWLLKFGPDFGIFFFGIIFLEINLAFAEATVYNKSYLCSNREMDFDFNQMVVTWWRMWPLGSSLRDIYPAV